MRKLSIEIDDTAKRELRDMFPSEPLEEVKDFETLVKQALSLYSTIRKAQMAGSKVYVEKSNGYKIAL